jgi:hypothetical protein
MVSPATASARSAVPATPGPTPPPTPATVEATFATPATVGLKGGRVIRIPRGTTDEVLLCIPLTLLHTAPAVQVTKRYATAGREIVRSGTGVFTEQGWVLPRTANADALMSRVASHLAECRYSGSASDPLDPAQHIRTSSVPARYLQDTSGWRGYAIRQDVWVNGKRASSSVRLLVQRGPVLLALEYIDYASVIAQDRLVSVNLDRLVAVLPPLA